MFFLFQIWYFVIGDISNIKEFCLGHKRYFIRGILFINRFVENLFLKNKGMFNFSAIISSHSYTKSKLGQS